MIGQSQRRNLREHQANPGQSPGATRMAVPSGLPVNATDGEGRRGPCRTETFASMSCKRSSSTRNYCQYNYSKTNGDNRRMAPPLVCLCNTDTRLEVAVGEAGGWHAHPGQSPSFCPGQSPGFWTLARWQTHPEQSPSCRSGPGQSPADRKKHRTESQSTRPWRRRQSDRISEKKTAGRHKC